LDIRFFSVLSHPKGFGAVRVCMGGRSFSSLVVDGGGAGVVGVGLWQRSSLPRRWW